MDTVLLLNIIRDLYIHKINRIIIVWKKKYIYISRMYKIYFLEARGEYEK